MFCGFLLMVHGVQAVTMCNVGMMGGLFMASGRIMLGSFLVVACCMFVVLRCLGMMFCAFFAHNMILVSCFWLMLGKKQCSITSVPKAHVALRVLRWEFILFLEAVVYNTASRSFHRKPPTLWEWNANMKCATAANRMSQASKTTTPTDVANGQDAAGHHQQPPNH